MTMNGFAAGIWRVLHAKIAETPTNPADKNGRNAPGVQEYSMLSPRIRLLSAYNPTYELRISPNALRILLLTTVLRLNSTNLSAYYPLILAGRSTWLP